MTFYQSKLQYLRIITTNRCNLSCPYCHMEGVEKLKEELTGSEIIKCCELMYKVGIRKIKLMGGEPTLREDMTTIIAGIRKFFPGIDISMVTNGILLEKYLYNYIEAGLNRINISFHHSEYEKKVQEITIKLNKLKILGKVNFVIQKGVTENRAVDIINWCIQNDITLDLLNILFDHESELHMEQFYINMEELSNFIEKNFHVERIEKRFNKYSLPSTRFILRGGGQVNLKNYPLNERKALNACEKCKQKKYCLEGILAIRLTNKGELKPCLFRKDNILNIKPFIQADYSEQQAEQAIYNYISAL